MEIYQLTIDVWRSDVEHYIALLSTLYVMQLLEPFWSGCHHSNESCAMRNAV